MTLPELFLQKNRQTYFEEENQKGSNLNKIKYYSERAKIA